LEKQVTGSQIQLSGKKTLIRAFQIVPQYKIYFKEMGLIIIIIIIIIIRGIALHYHTL
jgi:hypothetical protein